MTECDVQQLGAYHDGELTPAERTRVEAHLAQCLACAAQLAAIRDASQMLRGATFDDLTPAELANLHDAIDEIDDYRIWRLGASLGLIAASILIIGMAWLNAMPTGGGAASSGTGPVAVAPPRAPEPWERMAVTLRVYPPLPADGTIQPHDTQMVDFMLEGLALGN